MEPDLFPNPGIQSPHEQQECLILGHRQAFVHQRLQHIECTLRPCPSSKSPLESALHAQPLTCVRKNLPYLAATLSSRSVGCTKDFIDLFQTVYQTVTNLFENLFMPFVIFFPSLQPVLPVKPVQKIIRKLNYIIFDRYLTIFRQNLFNFVPRLWFFSAKYLSNLSIDYD